MQDRYAGDIGDYVKFGLLRTLAEGRRLGVAWYLFPEESRAGDGCHVGYLQRPDLWRGRDPELFDTLKQIVEEDQRSVDAIERSGILKGARFSNEVLSAPEFMCSSAKKQQRGIWRSHWFERVQEELRGCDVVFADPDNGLYVDDDPPAGTAKMWKRLPLHEAKALAEGRTVIIYHHNGRNKPHREEIRYWMEQFGSDTLALYWRRWSNRTFFIVHPTSDMEIRLDRFVREWSSRGDGQPTPAVELIRPSGKSFVEKNMTLEEMKSRFHSEWILIGDPDTDPGLNVRGGKVLYHSKDRDEVYRAAISLRPLRSAFMYTGRIPKDAAVVL